LFIPITFANDLGLVNPAAREFADIQFDTRKTGNFAQKSPVFNDRLLPAPRNSETIRQVSVNESDPFPVVTQSIATSPAATAPSVAAQPPPAQQPAFGWETAHPAVPMNPILAQHNAMPHNPHVAPHVALDGHLHPHAVMHMFQAGAVPAGAVPTGMEMGHFPQFVQHPQQFQIMAGMHPHIDPYAHWHAQYGFIGPHFADSHFTDPHGMWGHQNVPD
jgi:hypothetical protein